MYMCAHTYYVTQVEVRGQFFRVYLSFQLYMGSRY